MKNQIIEVVEKHYLESNDFNGLPYNNLVTLIDEVEEKIRETLKKLFEEDIIEIIYGDYHPNPHIKAFSGLDKKEGIAKLEKAGIIGHQNMMDAIKKLKEIMI